MKRSILVKDGTNRELVITKVTELKLSGKEMLHLDKLDDGTWRLVYTSNVISNLKELEALVVVREDE